MIFIRCVESVPWTQWMSASDKHSELDYLKGGRCISIDFPFQIT